MNSLKRYRVGRRELPVSVVRRVLERREKLDWEDFEPSREEVLLESIDTDFDDWYLTDWDNCSDAMALEVEACST